MHMAKQISQVAHIKSVLQQFGYKNYEVREDPKYNMVDIILKNGVMYTDKLAMLVHASVGIVKVVDGALTITIDGIGMMPN